MNNNRWKRGIQKLSTSSSHSFAVCVFITFYNNITKKESHETICVCMNESRSFFFLDVRTSLSLSLFVWQNLDTQLTKPKCGAFFHHICVCVSCTTARSCRSGEPWSTEPPKMHADAAVAAACELGVVGAVDFGECMTLSKL